MTMDNTYQFDASKYIIGRLASEVAVILQGKNLPTYQPNTNPAIKVYVTNIDMIKSTGKKIDQKVYMRHSGYPGHLKKRTLGDQLRLDSREVLRKAVYNMLPKNKLRYAMMKNLLLYQGSKD
jgi:large subunit ribosomal protein L13